MPTRAEAAVWLELGVCEVGLLDSDEPLHILLEAEGAAHSAKVEIKGSHTNIVSRCFDGAELLSGRGEDEIPDAGPDYDCLSLKSIIDYAENTDLEAERELLESQINCNRAVAIEGFLGEYGLNVGRSLLEHANYGPYVRAAAMAASGSDARMAGCQMPVVINSGSGNQGLTVSLPVISLSESWDSSHEQLLRALLISNLVSVHVKRAHRPAVGLLRGDERRERRRGGGDLAARRQQGRDSGLRREHTGGGLRHDLRRSQSFLRGKDSGGSGLRLSGASPGHAGQALSGRRRHRGGGRGGHHTQDRHPWL